MTREEQSRRRKINDLHYFSSIMYLSRQEEALLMEILEIYEYNLSHEHDIPSEVQAERLTCERGASVDDISFLFNLYTEEYGLSCLSPLEQRKEDLIIAGNSIIEFLYHYGAEEGEDNCALGFNVYKGHEDYPSVPKETIIERCAHFRYVKDDEGKFRHPILDGNYDILSKFVVEYEKAGNYTTLDESEEISWSKQDVEVFLPQEIAHQLLNDRE